MKFLLKWLPYVLSQLLLIYIIVEINLNVVSKSFPYYIGSIIALYGALLVLSSDFRRYMNKKNKVNK